MLTDDELDAMVEELQAKLAGDDLAEFQRQIDSLARAARWVEWRTGRWPVPDGPFAVPRLANLTIRSEGDGGQEEPA